MYRRLRVNERESKQYTADAATVRTTAVVALLAIGTIHFLQIVPTVQETPVLGLAYVALIAASVIVAAWLVLANDSRAWAAAGLISAAVLVGYAFTRLVGTSFDNQDVGNWACTLGLASIFVEAALLVLSGAALAFDMASASTNAGDWPLQGRSTGEQSRSISRMFDTTYAPRVEVLVLYETFVCYGGVPAELANRAGDRPNAHAAAAAGPT